ncbi:heliorhodopsin HeR [Chloroflexota bacterium]
MAELSSITLPGIRRFNFIMGFIHFIQAVLMLMLSSNFSLPITSSFQVFDVSIGKLVPLHETLIDLSIGPIVAAFLFMSAIAHFLISAPGVNRWYANNLGKGINHARWMEYSLSSSVMIVIIAMLVGIYDIASVILIFALNATMILFGWVMEILNQKTERVNWIPYWFGVFVGAIPWVVIAVYLIGAGNESGGPPAFVYAIFFSMFIFFNTFAVNMVLQYKKVGRWKDYLYGERAYIILSLVAKTALAWQVFAGTLRPV